MKDDGFYWCEDCEGKVKFHAGPYKNPKEAYQNLQNNLQEVCSNFYPKNHGKLILVLKLEGKCTRTIFNGEPLEVYFLDINEKGVNIFAPQFELPIQTKLN